MHKKRMLTYTIKTFASHLPITSKTLQSNIDAYLEKHLDYCTDLDFACYFPWKELNLPLPFFLQHIIQSQGEYYLAGPRFFGGNIHKPFIEVIASTGPLTQTAAHDIIAQWGALDTETLQVLRRINEPILGHIDQYIYVASAEDMARNAQHCEPTSTKNTQEINVYPATVANHDTCMKIITKSFSETHARYPVLKERVTPCTREEIREGIAAGNVYLIESTGIDSAQNAKAHPVGLIYLEYNTVAFLTGYVMTEESIMPEVRGHGLAAKAQIEIAKALAHKQSDALIVGTIDALNIASQKTAMHAGRSPLLRYEFVTPEQLADV
ncbi:hypothetical protein LMG33818_000176 [Halomonadaceae bacterium LMG 33818]|uniref:hypothetical protein n=1 Tax=Cernens ardua TaxID=3402176 RepID=UPI003EDBE6C4